MNLFKENEELVKQLEEAINNLKIPELEEQIKKENVDATSFREKKYIGYERLNRIKQRMCAINQKIISENELIKNSILSVNAMANNPCGIMYMDMPLNNQKYLVKNFYSKLSKKYEGQPAKIALLGLLFDGSGRMLRLENLDEEERKYATLLDEYLRICSIYEQMESLIDCIKSIQCNYLEIGVSK